MSKLTTMMMMTAATFALGVSGAFADKLSDFKEADRHESGCVTIPETYSAERRGCDSQAPHVHEWCDGRRGPVTCGNEDLTRQVKRGVENAKKQIADLKEKKSKAERDRSSAKTDDAKKKAGEEVAQLEKELQEAGRKLDRAEDAVAARRKLVDSAIYNLDKCIDYRRAVMNNFAHALDRVRNEDDTPELKALARSLRAKYQRGKSGHEEQISARTNALNNCKNWRP